MNLFLFIFLIVIIAVLIRFVIKINNPLLEIFVIFLIGIGSCALVLITPDVIHIPIVYHIFILPLILVCPFFIAIYFIYKKNKNETKTQRDFFKKVRNIQVNNRTRNLNSRDIDENQNL